MNDIHGSVIGLEKHLGLFSNEENKKGLGIKTNWIMHEYILVKSLVPPKDDISTRRY